MKSAIFDMDGTLLDSMTTWSKACITPLIKNKIKYPENIMDIITPLKFEQTAEYYRTLGLNLSYDELFSSVYDEMAYEYRHNIKAKPYVYDYLEKMQKNGTKMCILTATQREVAMPCLERLDLLKYFEFFLSCGETGMSKTNPEIYILAAKKLGFPIEETAVYEDNCNAVKSAKEAGAFVYGVYDKTSDHAVEEIKRNCDVYIKSFSELI